MCVDHVLDRVGDQFAARQRIEHAAVAHRDAVIDRDGVEFLGDAARGFDFAGHQLPEILQMDVARHELGEAVGDGDDRLAEIRILHARRAPKAAGAGHVAAVGGRSGAVCRHDCSLLIGMVPIKRLSGAVKYIIQKELGR